MTLRRIELLRAQWRQMWPESWHDGALRDEMIDRHAWLHAASSQPGEWGVGPTWPASPCLLAEQVVRDHLDGGVVGPFAPVVSRAGARPLRVERSRPGWHLSGVAAVPWSPAPRSLVVAGLDEGDNAVVALVELATEGVAAERVAGALATVRFEDVAVPEQRLAHAADAGAELRDRLTVLALMGAVDDAGDRAGSGRSRADVDLCRAAVGVAVRSAGAGQPLVRQHDVSAAAVVVLLTCVRLGVVAEGLSDLTWHRERLAPLL
ncbi:MAG: hypothetical protein ABWY58_00500 [Aeromicrobium sp.]